MKISQRKSKTPKLNQKHLSLIKKVKNDGGFVPKQASI